MQTSRLSTKKMGMTSSVEHEKSKLTVHRKIEGSLIAERKAAEKIIKLLLLGPGECGKSTILKQLRILHNFGFSEEELLHHRFVARANIVQSIRALILAMDTLKFAYANSETQVLANGILQAFPVDMGELGEITKETAAAIKKVWSDTGIQQCYAKSYDYSLNDSAKYFLDDVLRISATEYWPSQKDMLMCRKQTVAVLEIRLTLKKFEFRIIDVGGQRTCRRKWIHHFDNVNSIMFIAAISEYNQQLREDRNVNRLDDCLKLYSSVIGSAYFARTHIILLLNKIDLFAEKLKTVDLRRAYRKYNGPGTYEDALEYMKQMFLSKNKNGHRATFVYPTCATDTQQVQYALDRSVDLIIENKLKGTGLS